MRIIYLAASLVYSPEAYAVEAVDCCIERSKRIKLFRAQRCIYSLVGSR